MSVEKYLSDYDYLSQRAKDADALQAASELAPAAGYAALVAKWRAEAKKKLLRNDECSRFKDWPSPSCLETDAEMLMRCASELEAQYNNALSESHELEPQKKLP